MIGEWPKYANISLTLQERKYTDLRAGKPTPFGHLRPASSLFEKEIFQETWCPGRILKVPWDIG